MTLAPKTWADAEPIAEGDLNDMRDTDRFVLGHPDGPKPGARVTAASTFTLSSASTWTTVPLDTVLRDRTGTMSDATGLTIPLSGDYFFGFSAETSNVACNKDMRVLMDGTDVILFDAEVGIFTPTPARWMASSWMFLEIGTTLELQAWRDGANNVDVLVTAPWSPVLWAAFDGLGPA